MKNLIILIVLLAACETKAYQHRIIITGPIEILDKEESYIDAFMGVQNRESHISITCNANWNAEGPEDTRAPRNLITEACISGYCLKNNSNITIVTIWSSDFDDLINLKYIYCKVFMPEWYTTTGPHGFPDEVFPERLILSIRVPISVQIKEKNGARYCNEVDCNYNGCHCVSWY